MERKTEMEKMKGIEWWGREGEDRGKERREHQKEGALEQRQRNADDEEAESKDLGKGKRCSINSKNKMYGPQCVAEFEGILLSFVTSGARWPAILTCPVINCFSVNKRLL